MALQQRDPDLPLRKYAWRDAKDCYRTYWFIVPTGLLTTAATVTGALLPENVSALIVIGLGLASGAGVAFCLGFLVLVLMFLFAPSRRKHDGQRARLDALEARRMAAPSTVGTQVIAEKAYIDARQVDSGSIEGTATTPGGSSELWLPEGTQTPK